MPARIAANGNISDASVERFYSVRINHMMSSVTLMTWVAPMTFEFQVVHRYVFIVVYFCLK